MLAKRLKAKIGKDKKIILDVSGIPQGEVDIIILKKKSDLSPVMKFYQEYPNIELERF